MYKLSLNYFAVLTCICFEKKPNYIMIENNTNISYTSNI